MHNQTLLTLARFSLAFLWVFTGFTSIFFDYDTGYELLVNFGFDDSVAQLLIYSGAILDVSLGFWLLSNKHIKLCYAIQIIVIISYTILLTIIEPYYWLHPFGPLSKNLPIIMLLFLLYFTIQPTSNEKAQ